RLLQVPHRLTVLKSAELVRAMPPAQEHAADIARILYQLGSDEKREPELRIMALAAMPTKLALVTPATFGFLRSQLSVDLPVSTRSAAAKVLSQSRLSREQLIALTDELRA